MNRRPLHPKVEAASFSGAVATLIIGILWMAGVHPPADLGAAIATVVAGIAGYLAPERSGDGPPQL